MVKRYRKLKNCIILLIILEDITFSYYWLYFTFRQFSTSNICLWYFDYLCMTKSDNVCILLTTSLTYNCGQVDDVNNSKV